MGNPEMFSILTNEAGIVSPRVNRSLNSSCVSRLMGYTGNVIYIYIRTAGEHYQMDPEISLSEPSPDDSSAASDRSGKRVPMQKMLLRLAVLLGGVFLLVIIGLPTIVAMTGLHSSILDRVAEGRELSVTAESATLAWFAPVTLRNTDVKRDDESWQFSAEAFSTDRSLFQFLLTPAEIGTVNLDRPIVIVKPVNRDESDDNTDVSKSKTVYPELRTVISDGTVEVLGPVGTEPVISVDGISFVGRTEVENETSLLVIEPVKLFDRRELTPKLCDQGLQLIAPILSDSATVTGRLSIELDDFQIPIGTVTQDERVELTRISGRMSLHRVETGLKNPLLAKIASVLAAVSGGRFATIRVSEETEVRFQVVDGRVHHEGLTLLIPELASDLTIRTSGWVDLEENIDVQILVGISGLASSRIEVLSSLIQAPLEIRMTGTLTHPEISLPAGRNMLDQITERLGGLTGLDVGTSLNPDANLPGAISDLVEGLVGDEKGNPDAKKTARGIFDLINVIRNKPDGQQ